MEKAEAAPEAEELKEDVSKVQQLSGNIFSVASGLKISHRNRLISNLLSKPVALVNKEHFRQKLIEKVPQECRELIIEIPEEKDPYTDDQGRVTYFYTILGGIPIPVYQPGTIMFESAIKSDSNLVVEHGGQQNGPLLGNGCATFLAKFLGRLVIAYNKECALKELNPNMFYSNVYQQILEQTLRAHSKEDSSEHGRLISIKDTLLTVNNEKIDSESVLGHFYRKDIMELEGDDVDPEDAFKRMDSGMRNQLLQYRKEQSVFEEKQLFEDCTRDIALDIETFKQAYLVKAGLVSEEEKPLFHETLNKVCKPKVLNSLVNSEIKKGRQVLQRHPSLLEMAGKQKLSMSESLFSLEEDEAFWMARIAQNEPC